MANEISEKLVNISLQSSSLARGCLQRFIGTQYSETLANEFSKVQNQASSATSLGDKKYWSPDTTTILAQNKIALGGIGVIIATQITKRIVQRIGTRITQQITERILGRVGAATIPFLGEIVGGVMIGTDIINSYQGAFPHIQESLKSSEVKEAIRKEIVKTTETELRKESSQIASEIYNEGNQIEDVVKTELYKHLSPKELDRPLLKRILSLQDPSTIAKLSLLDVDDLRKLLMVSKPNLVALAGAYLLKNMVYQ